MRVRCEWRARGGEAGRTLRERESCEARQTQRRQMWLWVSELASHTETVRRSGHAHLAHHHKEGRPWHCHIIGSHKGTPSISQCPFDLRACLRRVALHSALFQCSTRARRALIGGDVLVEKVLVERWYAWSHNAEHPASLADAPAMRDETGGRITVEKLCCMLCWCYGSCCLIDEHVQALRLEGGSAARRRRGCWRRRSLAHQHRWPAGARRCHHGRPTQAGR